MEIRAYKNSPYGKIDLYARDGKLIVTAEIKTELIENSAVYQEPFISIDFSGAQILIDSLWECGIRPSEGTGSAGSLAATENHLKDMRAIVSKKLGVDL